MPIYSFQCNSDHTFEEWCSYEQSKLGFECPECGKKAKRIYSVSTVKPTFGNQDTLWNHREKHRKSMKGSQLNQSYTG
jgi:putative FmdB family regulatory protein